MSAKYFLSGFQSFGQSQILGTLYLSASSFNPTATTQSRFLNNETTFINDTTQINLFQGNLRMLANSYTFDAGLGEGVMNLDSSGNLFIGPAGGTNLDITDDFVTDTHISDGYTFRIGGRAGNSVVKTIWASPTELEIRLEGGTPGQVVGYDSDFGAGWVNGTLTYSDVITPLANSPLVITHNWGTTKVQVSVYDTATGEQVTPTTVSRDSNNVRVTMPTATEIEIVIIGFI